ncbi:MAG: hypothetical protein L0Z62_46505 [Gemmataceae bacterium]|nr:hypothetical protein [Gemmataceae bacterium]
MKGILPDANIEGHWKVLRSRLEGEYWREVWAALQLKPQTFAELDLAASTLDSELWHLCQECELFLITANRNKEGADSLEATIEAHNSPTSLPVFTIADPDRVLESALYADRVVESLLQYLLDIDNIRGTGRLYLP